MVLQEECMRIKNDKLIDNMVEALAKAAYDSGKVLDPNAWWPLNYLMYRTLFFADYYKDFLGDYEEVKRPYSLEHIAEAFKYPTAIWLALVNLPGTMRILGFDKSARVKVTLEFIEMLRLRMVENIFNE